MAVECCPPLSPLVPSKQTSTWPGFCVFMWDLQQLLMPVLCSNFVVIELKYLACKAPWCVSFMGRMGSFGSRMHPVLSQLKTFCCPSCMNHLGFSLPLFYLGLWQNKAKGNGLWAQQPHS